jgi:large subunit ribosomal protein L21
MYAVVEINGKQYRAEKGAVLRVDRMEAEKGSALSLDKVLLLSGDSVKVGAPYVSGAAVKATVQEEIKGDKIVVFKYKPKKDYRRTQGHRQRYTLLKVEEIQG